MKDRGEGGGFGSLYWILMKQSRGLKSFENLVHFRDRSSELTEQLRARDSVARVKLALPLPFVSNGGSSLLINMVAMGVLLNVSQQASATATAAMTGGSDWTFSGQQA